MTNLTTLTIAQARALLKSGEISAVELTKTYLEEIEKGNKTLNAYVAITAEQAYAMAIKSDTLLARGEGRPLEGIPLGIKDLFATRNIHTQACSRILEGFMPPYESTVTSKLWADGAIMLGKLNMDEFAMGSSNETSCYGAVINPWRRKNSDRPLVPGGSSGGSAAAVAARLCAGSIATDTGGSIRQPAAFTGTVGLKPTYGRCSRYGMIAFASSFDQAGSITRDIQDCAILLRSIASFDPKDSTSAKVSVPDYETSLKRSIKGMKIGIVKEYQNYNLSEEIQKLWDKGKYWLQSAGATIVNISLPHTKYALATYYIIASAEASSNLARYDGVRYGIRETGKNMLETYEKTRSVFGREVKRRIIIGTYVLSAEHYDAYYLKAQKVRNLIKDDFNKVFAEGVDAVLTPATPFAAFELADKERKDDPLTMYQSDIFTVAVNIAGLPALCVPASLSEEGLPLGLQLVGRPFDEETLLQMGNVIEQAAGTFIPIQWW